MFAFSTKDVGGMFARLVLLMSYSHCHISALRRIGSMQCGIKLVAAGDVVSAEGEVIEYGIGECF